ncbi:MAG: hypothetical protein E7491_02465 [Ruminococcaceae bacterium]|nr:hypothetical protein [Oscillospiraceae bacterium]
MDFTCSVKDFGAVGNGRHDDYSAIQAALDCGAARVIIPTGVYCISETLKVRSNTHIEADKTAKIVMKCTTRRKRNDFLLSNCDTLGGNVNISISGGIWDGNNTAKENAKPDIFDKQGYSGTILNFVSVENLSLSDMVLANSVTFNLRICKVHNFTIENISFTSDRCGHNQDGIHFGGDVKHGTVRNIRALSFGQTNDDMIALNADDSIERVENLDLCRDCIEDISIENIYAESCHTIIRMLSVTAPIRNIRIKNIYGGFRCNAINADAARYCRTPIFKESDYPEGVGAISDVHIENFTCYPVLAPTNIPGTTPPTPNTALFFESHMDNFSITGFRYACDDSDAERCPALSAKNLHFQKIVVDGKTYYLNEKTDTLKVHSFETLKMDRY